MGLSLVKSYSRPQYYDRSPTSVARFVSDHPGAVVLGGYTAWTYTVPASRKAFVESASGLVLNNSAVNLNAAATIFVDTLIGATAPRLINIALCTGETDRTRFANSNTVAELQAGEQVRANHASANNAVGSDVFVESGAKITEFDA